MTFVIDPSGPIFYYWSMVTMFAVLYNLIIIIVRCVFEQPDRDFLRVWLVLDYTSDFIYVFDMLIASRKGEYKPHHRLSLFNEKLYLYY